MFRLLITSFPIRGHVRLRRRTTMIQAVAPDRPRQGRGWIAPRGFGGSENLVTGRQRQHQNANNIA